jgi:hypothetical protein
MVFMAAEKKKQGKLASLEALAERLRVDIRYDPMAGQVQGIGGLCRVNGEYRIIVDRRFSELERAQVVADALRRFDLDPAALPADVAEYFSA